MSILEADTIRQGENKTKLRKNISELVNYSRQNYLAKTLSKDCIPRKMKWSREEVKEMDKIRRKLMTMYKALHPRDDVDRLYVSRKWGEGGLASIEDSVDASTQRFEDYIEKHEGGLITAIKK